jgi:hypothetical protein
MTPRRQSRYRDNRILSGGRICQKWVDGRIPARGQATVIFRRLTYPNPRPEKV